MHQIPPEGYTWPHATESDDEVQAIVVTRTRDVDYGLRRIVLSPSYEELANILRDKMEELYAVKITERFIAEPQRRCTSVGCKGEANTELYVCDEHRRAAFEMLNNIPPKAPKPACEQCGAFGPTETCDLSNLGGAKDVELCTDCMASPELGGDHA